MYTLAFLERGPGGEVDAEGDYTITYGRLLRKSLERHAEHVAHEARDEASLLLLLGRSSKR